MIRATEGHNLSTPRSDSQTSAQAKPLRGKPGQTPAHLCTSPSRPKQIPVDFTQCSTPPNWPEKQFFNFWGACPSKGCRCTSSADWGDTTRSGLPGVRGPQQCPPVCAATATRGYKPTAHKVHGTPAAASRTAGTSRRGTIRLTVSPHFPLPASTNGPGTKQYLCALE